MKAILKKPGEAAREVEIDNSLSAMQEAVGGYIEAVTICTDLAILCNEEGRLMGLEHNCQILGVDFHGPILLVGVDGEEFCDVPALAGAIIKGAQT